MKKLLLAALTTLSMSAFSQSFLITENGIVITTDTEGYSYDFGHYSYPQKVTLKGGTYFVEDNSILATVDENGLLYRKYEYIPENIIGKGINYFLSSEGALYTIDKTGAVKVTEDETLKAATLFGGNYFIINDEETDLAKVYTINKEGEHKLAELEGFKLSDIVAMGGTYFMNRRGIVHTINSDGLLVPRSDMRIGIIEKKGGNYFTDSSGFLYTVAADGTIMMPALPLNLKVNSITKLGSNYFLDLSGRLYLVNQYGEVFEREMRDHDFKTARVISL